MQVIKKIQVLVFTFLITISLFGGHLVGGELTYICLGDSTYRFNLALYLEPSALGVGNTPTEPALNFFEKTASGFGFVNEAVGASLAGIDTIYTQYTPGCVDTLYQDSMYVYKFTFDTTLARNDSGYHVSYWRCCRPDGLANINDENGIVLSVDVPGRAVDCNSTPVFDSIPPKFVCLNDNFVINSAASDPDGDSLVYSICPPMAAGDAVSTSQSVGIVSFLDPTDYDSVSYLSGYNSVNPFGNGDLVIDSKTGEIAGSANSVGNFFVVSVCVDEYRNDSLISRIHRDIPIAVVQCEGLLSADVGVSDTTDLGFHCGTNVEFENSSVGANYYFWDFGVDSSAADTSSELLPTYDYPDTGFYAVRLIYGDTTLADCLDTLVSFVKVKSSIKADFQSFQECDSSDVLFVNLSATDSSAKPYEYSWEVIGIDTVFTDSALFSFPANGDYNLNFEISDVFGCSDDTSTSFAFSSRPVAGFSMEGDSSQICQTNVTFTSTSTGSSDYFWNFGDTGTDADTSLLSNPSYTYGGTGDYNVQLIVGDSLCADTLDRVISVVNGAIAQFTYETECDSGLVTFVDATINGEADSIWWNFGSGSNYDSSVTEYTFSTNAIYPVTMTIRDTVGCMDSITNNIEVSFIDIAFSLLGGGTSSCELAADFVNTTEGADTYFWDFGVNGIESDTAVSQNASYTYSGNSPVNVTLVASNDNCSDTAVQAFTFLAGPVLMPIVENLCYADTVIFIDSSSSEGTFIASRIWNFGDGSSSSSERVEKLYASEGLYTYSLTVTDGNGCSRTASTPIAVHFPMELFFDYSLQGDSGVLCGTAIDISNPLYGIEGSVIEYDFGDGSVRVGVNDEDSSIMHTFPSAGSYNISFWATKTISGVRCDTSMFVTLNVVEPVAPDINFEALCDSGFWKATATGIDTSALKDYIWFVGEDSISAVGYMNYDDSQSDENLSIKLIVNDSSGCLSTTVDTFEYQPVPEANFVFDTTKAMVGVSIGFIDESLNGDTILWNIDNGDSTFIFNGDTSHVFYSSGWHTISQLVWNKFCQNIFQDSIDLQYDYRVTLPEIFSPNGDGQNARLKFWIVGLEDFELSIYDRWGKLVYKTNDLEADGWDGRNLKGIDAPPGEYVYHVTGIISGTDPENTELIQGEEVLKADRRGKVILIR